MLREVSHILLGRRFPHPHPNSAHQLLDTPKIELEFNYTFNLHVSTPILLQAHYFGTIGSVAGEDVTMHVFQMRQLILPPLIIITDELNSLRKQNESESQSLHAQE